MDGVHPTPGNPEFSPTAPYGVLPGAENVLFPHRYMLASKNKLHTLFFFSQTTSNIRQDGQHRSRRKAR